MSEELIEIEKLLVLKGEEIRQLKLNKATKEVLQPHIDELLKLKERYFLLLISLSSSYFFFLFL